MTVAEHIASQSGLFSTVVSAFLVDSYKKLSPDTGETTIALLAQISLQLNDSQVGPWMPPAAFKPSPYSVIVNILWFLSLVLALVCALAATLMQQWARSYHQAIEHRPSPHKKGPLSSLHR